MSIEKIRFTQKVFLGGGYTVEIKASKDLGKETALTQVGTVGIEAAITVGGQKRRILYPFGNIESVWMAPEPSAAAADEKADPKKDAKK